MLDFHLKQPSGSPQVTTVPSCFKTANELSEACKRWLVHTWHIHDTANFTGWRFGKTWLQQWWGCLKTLFWKDFQGQRQWLGRCNPAWMSRTCVSWLCTTLQSPPLLRSPQATTEPSSRRAAKAYCDARISWTWGLVTDGDRICGKNS